MPLEELAVVSDPVEIEAEIVDVAADVVDLVVVETRAKRRNGNR